MKGYYSKELTEYVNETGRFRVSKEFAEKLYYSGRTTEFRYTLEEFTEMLQNELDVLEV